MDNGTWPSRISVAVFLFETKDGGKQWFEKFHTQCKGSNIEIMDSVLGDTREEYRTGKSYWSLLSFCAFFFYSRIVIKSAICAGSLPML